MNHTKLTPNWASYRICPKGVNLVTAIFYVIKMAGKRFLEKRKVKRMGIKLLDTETQTWGKNTLGHINAILDMTREKTDEPEDIK